MSPQEARPVPALTVRQPWAELIVRGVKCVELRSWNTSYRGPMWLHASKQTDSVEEIGNLGDVFLGGLVGEVELGAILPMTAERWEAWRSKHLDPGPYRPGFYGWVLRAPRPLPEPIPVRGGQRLFYLNPEVLEKAAAVLRALSSNCSCASGMCSEHEHRKTTHEPANPIER